MKIDTILFDLDGTLWEVLDRSYESLKEFTTEYNLKEISRDTISKNMGMTMEECAQNYFPDIDKEKAKEYLNKAVALNIKRLQEYGGNIYEGLEETLKKLKRNYKLGIVSNCDDGYIEAFLTTSQLGRYFDDYLAAAKLQISKSDAIKEIIKRNNIKKAIYVGDTIKDKEASKEAKLEFIHAKYGFDKKLKHKYQIEKISELPNLLKTIDK